MQALIKEISPERPVLIVGPTASGKSNLALEIAARQGGVIINADALQVFANWRVLTARPPLEDEARAPHYLYGHIAYDAQYSVGAWLRDVNPYLSGTRPIIVGGTGLNFTALTEGLAEIPAIPNAVRAEANAMLGAQGPSALLAKLDPETASRIDQANPARIQRAWEVLTATGRPLASWQDETPSPLLPAEQAETIVLDAPKDWLTPRISLRFEQMLKTGALEEVKANQSTWDPDLPSSKAIGARELMAYLSGSLSLDEAKERAEIATRQYAKRQRTWFRAKMSRWRHVLARDVV
ncbi:MAG: tRNA (adenosine(37)-N6)-dimethylallyltransferase MiaA [Pseudomonadota bacterium]